MANRVINIPLLNETQALIRQVFALFSVLASFVAAVIYFVMVDEGSRSGSAILSILSQLIGSTLAFGTLYIEHTRLQRSSTGLMLYWMVDFCVLIIVIRTWARYGNYGALFIMLIIQAILVGISFCIENMTFVEDLDTGKRARPTPLGSNVNVFSRLTYWYMQPLLVLGASRPLVLEDLWRPDKNQAISVIFQKFEREWKKELHREKDAILSRALLRAFYPPLVVGFFQYWISFACSFVNPLLLSSMLTFIADPSSPNYVGYAISVGIFLAGILNVFMNVQVFINAISAGYQIRSALCGAIFRKSLKLSNTARQSTSQGQINNMITADTNHLMWFMNSLFDPIGVPLKIVISNYLLWQQLGVSYLGGMAVFLVALPLQGLIGKRLKTVFDIKQKRADARIELVNETMSSIKLLKLYGWDVLFHTRVMDARFEELKSVRSIGILKSLENFMVQIVPLLVSLVSFAIFSIVNSSNGILLDANRVFVSLSIFSILSDGLNSIGMLVTGGPAALTCINRVKSFLLLEEIADSNVSRGPSEDENVVVMENGSFNWDSKSKVAVLANMNFKVAKGNLFAVIGRVGVGKSSLLSSLIGEMHKLNGSVRLSGSVAYVGQQAWIENATIRDNILFGSEFDEAKFQAVIDSCALRSDLKMFPAGDLTEIGERGVNLSGGQKQRLALARAVYNDADVYLLDDVLSAVDAHVDKHLFDNVIGPQGLLKSKTRIFVTHGVHHLASCDRVLVLKNGIIEEQGTFRELMEIDEGTFRNLITEYSQENSSVSENNEATEEMDSKNESKDGSESVEDSNKGEGKLMTKEDAGKGLAKSSAFVAYAKAAGLFWVFSSFVLLVAAESAVIGTRAWLDNWTTNATSADAKSTGYYLGIYGALVVIAASLNFFTNLVMYLQVGISAAKVMHSKMLSGVMHSPMSFFDVTPIGRITNRFVGDVQIVDENFVDIYVQLFQMVTEAIATVVVICSVTPLFLTIILPLVGVYYYLQSYYLKTAQSTQRVNRLTNSPVYSLASTAFAGISTIRAFGKTQSYVHTNDTLQDDMQTGVLTLMTANKWLQFRLECLGAIIGFGAAIFAVVQRNSVNSGSVGLSLSYALQITQYLYHTMRLYGQVQNSGISLERIFDYFDLPREAPQETNLLIPKDWPSEGRVVFKHLMMRYSPEMPLVLKGIDIDIRGGEKVGIVGRTGSGKSSLTVSLFRLVEASEGVIEIDGLDISKIGLNLLRTKITIIPQEPVLFGATLRDNIDPAHWHSDEAIWAALEASHLKSKFIHHEEGLEQSIKSGGENMSVGERQLFCLARAILRNTKVLVLDEATAGIDLETDALIQATIRKEFKNSTILTIAHRINTIMDSDKIVVLNAGRLEEMDSPQNLLANPQSAFSQLAMAAGIIQK
ncbi:hypothetical protein HDU83_003188 [Entophlyctis luteolus]|nr:hypothetical protein HDU83_003188 [Entophlyctis luteolus]